MGWRGMAVGALSLIALYALVQPRAAGRVSGLPDMAAKAVTAFLDPHTPTIGDPGTDPTPPQAQAPAASSSSSTPAYDPDRVPVPRPTKPQPQESAQ